MKIKLLIVIMALLAAGCQKDFYIPSDNQEGVVKHYVNLKWEYVQFSDGNLIRWTQSGNWQFAPRQNAVASTISYRGDNRPTDLFVWSSVDSSQAVDEKWISPNFDEWCQLLYHRPGISFSKGNVNGMNGLLIYPEQWRTRSGLTPPERYNDWTCSFSRYVYSAEEWAALEASGVVFLPCAGRMDEEGVISEVGEAGYYWTVSPSETYSDMAWALIITDENVMLKECPKNEGYAIRPFRIINPK